MTLSRRRLVIGLGTAAIAGSLGLGASLSQRPKSTVFAWRFGHGFPADHPIHSHAVAAATKIREETGGKVDIGVYPNSQLGGDVDLLSQVRSGGIEMFSTGGVILSSLLPVAALSGIGFIFDDYRGVWSAMDGKVGHYIRTAFERVGLHPLERIWDNGFRQITCSSRPIETPQDLQGLKIRVPASPLYVSLFRALRSAPASINLAEVYTSLQTRVVEAQENPLIVTNTAKFYEVQRYCSLTSHMWDGSWMIVNSDAWAAMPGELQEVVARHFNDTALAQRRDVAQLNGSLQQTLSDKGVIFNKPPTEPFRDFLREVGFYESWQKRLGAEAWDTLEAAVGRLI